MMPQARRLLLLLPLILAQPHVQCLADSAYLQTDSIYEGDIAELVIEYDNPIPSLYALDSSGLERDFEILEIKPKIFRVNEADRVFHRMQWKLQIVPRRNGRLSIPVLRFGDRSTPPLHLDVAPLTAEMQTADDVFVETEASPESPYPGQQIRVATRLYHNTPISQGRLSEPAAQAAQIHRQGDETRFRQAIKGVDYDVVERKLLMFAQQDGDLEISAAGYRGQLRRPADATPGGGETGSRKIYRRSNGLKLALRALPSGYSGKFWLPAHHLEISQQFSTRLADLEVGDSLDWNLVIVARGLPAESLPEDLLLRDSDRLRIYADQPVRSNRFDGDDLVGRLEQRFAVIATSPGAVELTAPVLKWWDVKADRERAARLESRSFQVTDPASGAWESPLSGDRPGSNGWRKMLLISPQTLPWLLTGLLMLFAGLVYRPLKRLAAGIAGPAIRRHRIARKLRQSCMANHAAQTRRALIEWGRERWPLESINGLRQIAERHDSAALADRLAELDAALYSTRQQDWQGGPLWRQIKKAPAIDAAGRAERDTGLAALYPQ